MACRLFPHRYYRPHNVERGGCVATYLIASIIALAGNICAASIDWRHILIQKQLFFFILKQRNDV